MSDKTRRNELPNPRDDVWEDLENAERNDEELGTMTLDQLVDDYMDYGNYRGFPREQVYQYVKEWLEGKRRLP